MVWYGWGGPLFILQMITEGFVSFRPWLRLTVCYQVFTSPYKTFFLVFGGVPGGPRGRWVRLQLVVYSIDAVFARRPFRYVALVFCIVFLRRFCPLRLFQELQGLVRHPGLAWLSFIGLENLL